MAGFDKVRPGFFLALRRQARDVTFDIADELRRSYPEFDEVPASVLRFLELTNRH
jgi:hypothetical protein